MIFIEDFGAVGDGVTNDTLAIQAAFNVGGYITCRGSKTFLTDDPLSLSVAKSTVDLNGSTLKFAAAAGDGVDLDMINVSAADCTFKLGYLDGSAATHGTHRNTFIRFIRGAHRGRVLNCSFSSLPAGGSDVQSAVAFLTGADDGLVMNCHFSACPGSVFSQGARQKIDACLAIDPVDVSFALNGPACIGGHIANCKVFNGDVTVSGHIAIEEAASDWSITGNYVRGVKNGGGIMAINVAVFTDVVGGVISGNFVDGGGFSSATSALLKVSAHYKNCRIVGNLLRGMSTGAAKNRAAIIPAFDTLFHGNYIDATNGAGAVAAVEIDPAAAGRLDIIDNKSDCTGGPGRHYYFHSGDFGSRPVLFQGGRLIGGSEGVNANLSVPTNLICWFVNIDECTARSPVAISTAIPAFGDRQTYINTHGAFRWPHTIKDRTVMYGNAAPAAGTWSTGDEVIALAPSAAATDRWRCTAGGTPGTWKAGTALAP